MLEYLARHINNQIIETNKLQTSNKLNYIVHISNLNETSKPLISSLILLLPFFFFLCRYNRGNAKVINDQVKVNNNKLVKS